MSTFKKSISDDLSQLEKYIDNEYISSFCSRLEDYPLNKIVLNTVRYLEYTNLDYEVKNNRTHPDLGHQLSALSFAAKIWPALYCKKILCKDFKFVLSRDKECLDLVVKIFGESQKYSQVCNYFFYIRKNILHAKINLAEKIVVLDGCDKNDQLWKITNMIFGSPEIEEKIDVKRLKEVRDINADIVYFLDHGGFDKEKNKYNFNDTRVRDIYNRLHNSYGIVLWSLNDSWDLGGYTVAQFRMVFSAILTISKIHRMRCVRDYLPNFQMNDKMFNDLSLYFSRVSWNKIINKITNLDVGVIAEIVSLFVYDVKDDSVRRRIGFTMDIFFDIGNDVLVMSHTTALNATAERNLWMLLANKNTALHSSLSNRKEVYWLADLEKRLKESGLMVRSSIKIKEKGNIDLLLIDYRCNFGLTIELKWLTKPNRVLECSGKENNIYRELSKGNKQAYECSMWANNNRNVLCEKISVPIDKIAPINFKGLVLSKNIMGPYDNSKNYDSPVISEQLFWWIFSNSKCKNLSHLYNIVANKKYAQKEGVHYKIAESELNFAGYKFIQKNQYLLIGDVWNPEKNISFDV